MRRLCQTAWLWFCQRQYDGAMARGDLADANWWAERMERAAGW